MRRILWGLVILAALWCAWWGFGAYSFYSGLTNWFEDRRTDGWQADVSDIKMSGFPARIVADLPDFSLADPESGLALSSQNLQFSLRALWPGDIRMSLPATPVQIATPQAGWTLAVEDGVADLNLNPGTGLELENMSFASAAFGVQTENGAEILGGEALSLAMTQQDQPELYAIRFDAQGFTPGRGIRDLLEVSPNQPLVFDAMTADILVEFDTSIDRATWEQRRPQPQAVAVNQVDIRWGDMRLLATGNVVRDGGGFAEGDLIVKADNWQKMLDLATAAGFLPSGYRSQAERMLGLLARSTGNTDDLDVTFSFSDGLTRIGFFPIGPAPSLVIR